MGCAQSRVDNEEAVARCKERRNVIKEAVTASKAFAAGHFAYAIALKNTGAALSDYGHGESDQTLDVLDHQQQSHDRRTVDPAPQPPPPPPIENLPPPPPPLPKFSPSPIKRAISLPSMAGRGRKLRSVDSMAIEEEDEEEEEEEEQEEVKEGRKVEEEEASPRTPENVGNGRKRSETTPEIVSASPGAWDYFFMVENMPGPNLDDRGIGNGYENRSNNNNNQFQFNEEEEEDRSEIYRKISGHKAVEEMEPKTPEKLEEVEEEDEDEDDEEEEEEEEEEEDEVAEAKKKKKKGKAKIEHSTTAPADLRRAVAKTVKTNVPSVNLKKILDEIDDRFLKASECAQEVSKMLEATRLHYHSNFADNQGIKFGFSSLIQSLSNAYPCDSLKHSCEFSCILMNLTQNSH